MKGKSEKIKHERNTQSLQRIPLRSSCRSFMPFVLIVFSLLSLACGANDGILRSGKETPTQVNTGPEKTPIARDIEAMQTAGFSFIYVLRRRDGGLIDAGDRGVIRLNTAETNRRVVGDEERAVVIGSKFQLEAKNIKALYDRFAVEDYSQPPAAAANINANANK